MSFGRLRDVARTLRFRLLLWNTVVVLLIVIVLAIVIRRRWAPLVFKRAASRPARP